jgi:hypothetical protein
MAITGPDGRYRHIPVPEIPEPITERHIIELQPGEFFGTVVDLTWAVREGTEAGSQQTLSQTAGTYMVTIRYAPGEDVLKDVGTLRSFRGPVVSKPLKLTVEREAARLRALR